MEEFAIYKTKIGYIKMKYQNDKITFLKKIKNSPENIGVKTNLTNQVYQQLIQYFDGKRKDFDFPYQLIGTPFQIKVWQALTTIPFGQTRTYKEIATLIGNEKASRAIGMANHKNPIHFVIPCHRVIGTNGKLTGYASGVELKSYLLDLEKI